MPNPTGSTGQNDFWASDKRINTEKMEQRLKQNNKGMSLTHARHILSQQIKLITQLMETDKKY